MRKTTVEICRDITDRIISALENNDIPWRKPWSCDPNCSPMPKNIASDRRYSGVNILLLWIASLDKYQSHYWGTYKQWLDLGGQVRRGEKGTTIVFWRVRYKVGKEYFDTVPPGVDPKDVKKAFVLNTHKVFNLEQVKDESGGKLDKYKPVGKKKTGAKTFADYGPAEEAIKATGAEIRYGGNLAAYSPPVYHNPTGSKKPVPVEGTDCIRMPHRRQFASPADFYESLFHELIHWTGPRLKRTLRDEEDRVLTKKEEYAAEELVAEIGACFLSQALQIPQGNDLKNHAAYIKTWLKAMRNDPKWIITASTRASTAADYILHFSRPVDNPERFGQPDEGEDEPAKKQKTRRRKQAVLV